MRNTLLVLAALLVFGCTNNQDKTEIVNLTQEIEKLKSENEELRKTIDLLKYPASDRLIQIKKLITNNSFAKAQEEINQLRNLFPQSSEAQECNVQEKIIEEKQKKNKSRRGKNKSTWIQGIKRSFQRRSFL